MPTRGDHGIACGKNAWPRQNPLVDGIAHINIGKMSFTHTADGGCACLNGFEGAAIDQHGAIADGELVNASLGEGQAQRQVDMDIKESRHDGLAANIHDAVPLFRVGGICAGTDILKQVCR